MHILFVDDSPGLKVQPAINHLKGENLNFSYEIVGSVNKACRYLCNHLNEIDLAIIDLGLPQFDNSHNYNELNGLSIIKEMLRKNINIPTIINSSTKIPNEEEFIKQYATKNTVIKHVDFLDGKWLSNFIKQL